MIICFGINSRQVIVQSSATLGIAKQLRVNDHDHTENANLVTGRDQTQTLLGYLSSFTQIFEF